MHAFAKQMVLSAHPVADEVRSVILQQLAHIEHRRTAIMTYVLCICTGCRGI